MAREARDGAHVARVPAPMTCPACGHENRDDAAFCEECGGRLEQICRSCETTNALNAKFCRMCGTALVHPAAPAISPEPTPRTYTPKHLAEKILQSKFALEGERKQVTVLFADVKSSVELSAQVDLEEWHRILDRFFRILTEGVHHFEGTVNQYTGDGIMALFGAPIAHEDHAQRACYAALRIRDALRRFTNELQTTSGVAFHTRIGLNCGDVIVGKIGDDLRMDYTAQGQTVGLASRVEGLANPGEVCLTAHTARLVEGYFQLRDRGLFPLKGLAEPQRLYELTGVGRLHTRLDVARAHGLSQFVGRSAEMATLELALQRTRDGDGQVVGVVGEAGVGKSRLCLECVERCRAEAMRVIEAHCPAYGKTIPLLPIRHLLRNVFGIAEGDRDQVAREKIEERLVLLDRAFEDVLPLVADFLGVPDPEHPLPPMVPEVRQRQLFAFLRRLVQAESDREPVVLLIDDLHWIDPGSDTFLTQLVEAVSGTRTLLLLNFRPEYHPAWTSMSYYHQVSLSPLGPEAIDVLLHALLGTDPLVISLPDLIRERTGGNPFFIEEVIQSLAESGVLAGAQGAYRLTGTLGAFAIPATVQPVLAARIDRLAEREKQVLQTASVIGRQFSEPLLGRVVQLPEADLSAALSHLRSAEFIREKAFYPEVEYVFKHSLTQEVAYDVQLSERRQQLHAVVAQGLEALHADKLDEQAALLAHHWEQAGEGDEALRWHERAARWIGEKDPFEADRHWRRVRALAHTLPESGDAIRAQVQSCQALLKLGPLVGISREEARVIFLEGTTLAQAQQDLPARALLEIEYAQISVEHNEFQDALDHAQEAVRLAVRLDDLWLRVRGALQVMSAFLWLGRLHDGWAVCQRTLELVGEPADLGQNTVEYLALLELKEIFMIFMGRPREALVIFDRLITVVRELGVEEQHSDFYHVAVFAASLLGDAERALQLAHREVELAERYGAVFMRIGAQLALAMAKNLNGDWEGALEAVATMRSIIRETGMSLRFEVPRLHELSVAQLGSGDHVAARESATEARRLARARDLKFQETLAVVRLIRAVLAEGPSSTAEAEALIAQAIQLIETTGMKSFQPDLDESRAELARLLGDDPARSRYLHDAYRLYTEMGATAHAERVARDLAL